MKVYFFCYPDAPADRSGYEHQIVCIAEGFKFHCIEFNGNIDYWKKLPGEDSFLIKSKDADFRDFDVVVFSTSFVGYNRLDLLPDDLFNSKRKYKLVFIDGSDGLITPGFDQRFRNVDIVLKSHYNKKYDYPLNFVPWQFGLTDRIISSSLPLPFEQRKREILTNFRVKHPVREIAEKKVMSILYKYFVPNNRVDAFDEISDLDEVSINFWKQTGRRHYPDFYRRLGMSQSCAAFGGYFQKSIENKNDFFSRVLKRLDSRFDFINYDMVYQFDSWRFWESLVSGCCTFYIDLERYGGVLPVMPINGRHYIGVDFDNLSKLKRLLNNKNSVEDIANAGREWVLENYSPEKIAERFLNLVE